MQEVNHQLFSDSVKNECLLANEDASEQEMLIFDEPTSGLDFRHMCQVEKLMKRLAKEKYIIIVVTHDYEFLNRTCKGYIRINEKANIDSLI